MTDIRCTRCLQDKDITEFYSYKLNADGETGRCKVCTAKTVKKWKHKNPKVVLMYLQRARLADPEKFKERDRRIYQNRKLKILNK